MRKRINNQILTIRELRKNINNVISKPREETNDSISEDSVILNFETAKNSLKDLKIAAIMDRFTLECFRPECNLLELTPNNWKEEIDSFNPDLLFIETAWEGKEKLWYQKVSNCCEELVELTTHCRTCNIPIIFWSKEDPVHNTTFMSAAALADFVFTTDIECIESYKRELGHNRVYHLHFGAQPKTHNPIEKFERKDKFCFAGSYYHRYKDRCEVFDSFAEYFISNRGFDIYDRNYNRVGTFFKFPEFYDPYILGCLDPSEIDIAYKGYTYGINMNSVTQSQTMFARRVFELIASNTVVVGNFSRGVKNYFGDLTFCTNDKKTLIRGMERYCADSDSSDKFRLVALRKVLSEHLMEDRLDYIVQKVFGKSLKNGLPVISVYSFIENQNQADRILTMFTSQNYSAKKLFFISDTNLNVPKEVKVIKCVDFGEKPLLDNIGSTDYIACFDSRDWYGKNYLLDMALATRYGKFEVIGKSDYYTNQNGKTNRLHNNTAYHLVSELANRRCIVSSSLLSNITGEKLTPDYIWNGEGFMAVDAINYCENHSENTCQIAQDIEILDQGFSTSQIEEVAKKVKIQDRDTNSFKLLASDFSELCSKDHGLVNVEYQNNDLIIKSQLPIGQRQYLFLEKTFDVDLDLQAKNNKIQVMFQGITQMLIHGYCLFYDEYDSKIDVQSFKFGIREDSIIPKNAAYMKLAFRISGPGTTIFKAAEFGEDLSSQIKGGSYLARSNAAVLTTLYPAPDDLYRRMFVHKRLTEYKDNGKLMDVLCINQCTNLREFEGINVMEVKPEFLKIALENNSIDTVCVHMMMPIIWEALKFFVKSTRILIWVHGAEIQPWWRREYNFNTDAELRKAKLHSEKRMALWQKVFKAAENNPNIHFVFVSEYFRDEIFEDYKITLPEEQYSIIHNCIDTEQFNYVPKKSEDRKKLLSIRPYASNKYANDLTVKAILELSKESWFNELDIALYGSGELFEKTLAPLREFKNVKIVETFLTQNEIAELHKQYGVFLTPTRMDSQGVSRDEAMSSGLVPVTNAVTAIPEFVDEDCGILAAGEDYIGMAEGIKKLYHNPELFLKMSENAAKRVRNQTSKEFTIKKELDLIFSENNQIKGE